MNGFKHFHKLIERSERARDMTKGDRPLDLKALLDDLSSFASRPPTPVPPAS